MNPRYILMVASEPQGLTPELVSLIASRAGLRPAVTGNRLALLANDGCPWVHAGETGCLVGSLFHRHGPALPIARLNPDETASIKLTGGDVLIRRYWGGYVAAFETGRGVRIMRDPSAGLSCYFACAGGITFLASDAALLVGIGVVEIDLDWAALARDLYKAGVPEIETCLGGICELMGGFALTIPGSGRQAQCWSPWDYVEQPVELDVSDQRKRLACTVRQCVRGWSAGRGRLLLSVSGGLDSSIVAAVLAGSDVTCLTMFSEDPSGDERQYARMLCAKLGLPLIERPYNLEDIDITEPLGANLPRPRDRTQALSYERTHLEVARAVGAEAFVTGNGGDSVFGYSQSAAAVADRYLAQGLTRGTFTTLRDVCGHTGCSLLDAARAAYNILVGPREYKPLPNRLFLDADVLAEQGRRPISHPWLNAPQGALPGKSAHIAWILRVQQCLEPSRSQVLHVLNPLLSQPIMEFCLGIPSWEWRSGGRDRALARQAFATVLPPAIIERRIKGSPGYFAGQILDRFRSQIRERILDGNLAHHRLIDAQAISAAIQGGRPCSDEERVRILEFVAVEAWVDHWRSHSAIEMP